MSDKRVVVDGLWIVLFASFFQIYLGIRLWLTRPIAFAKLDKAWGLDELKANDDFLKTAQQLKDMVSKSLETTYPSDQFDAAAVNDLPDLITSLNHAQKAMQSVDNIEGKISDIVEGLNARHGVLVQRCDVILYAMYRNGLLSKEEANATGHNFSNVRREENPKRTYNRNDAAIIEQTNRFLAEYVEMVRDDHFKRVAGHRQNLFAFINELVELTSETEKQLARFRRHKQYCEDFPTAFSETALAAMLDRLTSNLVKVRRRRIQEFNVIEIALPSMVVVFSLLIASDVLFDWMEGATAIALNTPVSAPWPPSSSGV